MLAVLCRGTRDQALAHALWLRDDIDLSYLNGPDLMAMLLMADYRSMTEHHHIWGLLPPPTSCMDKLFVTAAGVTVQQQLEKLLQVSSQLLIGIRQTCLLALFQRTNSHWDHCVCLLVLQGLATLTAMAMQYSGQQ